MHILKDYTMLITLSNLSLADYDIFDISFIIEIYR